MSSSCHVARHVNDTQYDLGKFHPPAPVKWRAVSVGPCDQEPADADASQGDVCAMTQPVMKHDAAMKEPTAAEIADEVAKVGRCGLTLSNPLYSESHWN